MSVNVIRSLRKGAGMTQKELADKLGTTITTVYRWEKGEYVPSPRYIKRMAEIFGVKGRDIFLATYTTKVTKEAKNNEISQRKGATQ